MMFAACLLQAGMIDIDSKPGLANTLTGATVTIGIHPAWQTNNPQNPGDTGDTSAVWISYAPTGFDGSVLQLPEGQTAVASIFHSFTSGTGGFQLLVWADDSTQVFMDNVLLTHAESYPIGFAPDRFGTFAEALTAGSHTLEFRLFQQGPDFNTHDNPFGLLYTGTAPTTVPEPGTPALMLVGGVLLLLGRTRFSRNLRLWSGEGPH